MGILDDPWAETMLRSLYRGLARVLRWPGVSRAGQNRTFAYLAARTFFYDQAVRDGLDCGVNQVVIVGAGYDSRPWRLALGADEVAAPLRAAGLSDSETTLYVAEGLIMYLSEVRSRHVQAGPLTACVTADKLSPRRGSTLTLSQ